VSPEQRIVEEGELRRRANYLLAIQRDDVALWDDNEQEEAADLIQDLLAALEQSAARLREVETVNLLREVEAQMGRDCIEENGAHCPEDRSCGEYITALTKRAEAAEARLRGIEEQFCAIAPESSRICELGTKGCTVEHKESAARLRAIEAKTLPKDQQRLYDLVRFARGYLHDSELITNEEYGALAETGASSARRLEGYDEIRAKLLAAEARCLSLERENQALKDRLRAGTDTASTTDEATATTSRDHWSTGKY